MTSIDNSASAQAINIRKENCELQEQIDLWKMVPLSGAQAVQLRKMINSVGPALTTLNRQSYIDSNVRFLQKKIENNQAKIEKRFASEQYRKNLRSGASKQAVASVQPAINPVMCAGLGLVQMAQKSKENDRDGVDPAEEGSWPTYGVQDVDAMQSIVQQQKIENEVLMAAYPGMSLHAIAVQRFADAMDDYCDKQ